MTSIWLQFLVCVVVILFAGFKLSRYGDMIADRTGLGRTWIGVVLMASVTSLPELFTGVSSVTLFNVPDIAVGSILGSCMFNILIIALLDALERDVPILTRTHEGQVLTGAFGVILLGLVAVGLVLDDTIPTIGWVGLYSFGFVGLYLITMRSVFLYELKRLTVNEGQVNEESEKITSTKLYALYTLHAIFIIGAATYLPHIGEQIAKITGLGQTFVGSLFIAFITSLPEVVISVSALRLGAVDMAVGNLLGSNLFNIGILAISDLFYTRGPLLAAVTSTHITTALAAMVMSALAIVGLTYRAERKRLPLFWDTMGIVAVYLTATHLLWDLR